jgi:hypothetical protein
VQFFCGEFQGRETIRSLAHAQDVVKWRGMVMCFRTGGKKITELGRFFPTDLAHSDFHLFCGPKKDVIRGKMSGSDNNVTEEVGKWVRVRTLKWYKRATEALVSRWCKAVEVDGDMQKSEVCSTSI